MQVEPVSSEWLRSTIKRCPVSGVVIDTEVTDKGIAVILYESNWEKFSPDQHQVISEWLNFELLAARNKGLPVYIQIEERAVKR